MAKPGLWQRMFWSGLLAVVVFGPLTLLLVLLLAAQLPVLDEFTLQMPMGFREMVSQMALRQVGDDGGTESRIYRVIELDPVNEPAWSRLCAMDRKDDPASGLTICRRAISLRATARSFNGLGRSLEAMGDLCGAEEAYGSAIAIQRDSAMLLRNLGRAALRCGHDGAAVQSFEMAERLDEGPAREVGDEETVAITGEDTAGALRLDQNLLIVAYGRAHEPEKASVVCARVYPGWASCVCSLLGDGVDCVDGAGGARR